VRSVGIQAEPESSCKNRVLKFSIIKGSVLRRSGSVGLELASGVIRLPLLRLAFRSRLLKLSSIWASFSQETMNIRPLRSRSSDFFIMKLFMEFPRGNLLAKNKKLHFLLVLNNW